jgi:hypothetical protein
MSAALRATLVALFTAGALSGCGAEHPRAKEYLDPQTAVTVRVVAEPFIYAHDVPALAANVRDYLSVGAVELNNMGRRTYYLALVAWSTVDRKRLGAPAAPLPATLRLSLGTSVREFTPATRDPRSIGVGLPLFRPATGYLGDTWYALTAADLRALAAAPPATFELVDEQGPISYALWRDATPALVSFVREIPEAVTPVDTRPR